MTTFYRQDSMRRHTQSSWRIRVFIFGILVGWLLAKALA